MDALKCLCLRACQAIIWVIELFEPVLHINLLNGSKEERREAKLSGRNAQLVEIWARATTITAAEHDLTNFLFTHHSYVSPSYVLTHDNVTLHSFNNDLVIFAVSDPQVTESRRVCVSNSSGASIIKQSESFPLGRCVHLSQVSSPLASGTLALSGRGGWRPNHRRAHCHHHPYDHPLWINYTWTGI